MYLGSTSNDRNRREPLSEAWGRKCGFAADRGRPGAVEDLARGRRAAPNREIASTSGPEPAVRRDPPPADVNAPHQRAHQKAVFQDAELGFAGKQELVARSQRLVSGADGA
jgi:hypothetical protein